MKPCRTPELLEKFQKYKDKNCTWGSLHVVLDDGNVDDSTVKFCIQYANERGDIEAVELGNILIEMSKTQRLKIANEIK